MSKRVTRRPAEKPEEREDRMLNTLKALAGEHFSDYVIITRSNEGGMVWKSSNGTWAKGACERLAERIRDDDHFHARDCWEPD